MARLKLFSLMTCFTHRREPSEGGKVIGPSLAEGRDAVESDGCVGTAGTVRDAGEPGAGESGGGVPGVWDLASDRIFVAAAVSGAGSGRAEEAESSSAARAGAARGGSGRADRGVAAAASGLGGAQTAGAAAAARSGVSGSDDTPGVAAPGNGARAGSASAGAAAI